jgi:hypothetical protein
MAREKDDNYLSLVFLYIPLPKFGDRYLSIRTGRRREPTEGLRVNSHFYKTLVKERISALGCGHDHVNGFCALLRLPCLLARSLASRGGKWALWFGIPICGYSSVLGALYLLKTCAPTRKYLWSFLLDALRPPPYHQ